MHDYRAVLKLFASMRSCAGIFWLGLCMRTITFMRLGALDLQVFKQGKRLVPAGGNPPEEPRSDAALCESHFENRDGILVRAILLHHPV